MTEKPKHGDERNARFVMRGARESLGCDRNGNPLGPIPVGCSWDGDVSEIYCEDDGWQEVEGILNRILGCPVCGREW